MTLEGWRYVTASVVGSSHMKVGGMCQDANDCQLYQLEDAGSVLVAVVADGAGSSKYGGEGAALTCNTFMDLASDFLSSGNVLDQFSDETAKFWLTVIRNKLVARASSQSETVREFSCTLLGAILSDAQSVFLQVGDGAIVVADSEELEYAPVFWPDRGEYENTTHFVTQEDVYEHLRFNLVRRKIVEVALFSDGLQRLALNYKLETAHEPFFRGLFEPLQRAPIGKSDTLSEALSTFLGSSRVNEKTDDDKTLILASRKSETNSAI